MLANPAARVRIISARTRSDPHHRVSAANAGGYRTAAIATPAMNPPAPNTTRLCDVAMTTSAGIATTDPAVMTHRGPYRSSSRPTGMPTTAATSWPIEKAATMEVVDHPVSAVIAGESTRKA